MTPEDKLYIHILHLPSSIVVSGETRVVCTLISGKTTLNGVGGGDFFLFL